MHERPRETAGKFLDKPLFHPYRVEKKELGKQSSLEDVVVQATFDKNRAIDPRVSEIDLGRFFDEAENLAQQTIADKRHRERSALIWIRKKIYRKPKVKAQSLISIDPQMSRSAIFATIFISPGNSLFAFEDEVSARIPNVVNKTGNYLGSALHTHNIVVAPSNSDLTRLLIADRKFRETFVFVSTIDAQVQKPGKKYLVFRGPQTPQMNKEQLKSFLDEQNKEFTPQSEFKATERSVSDSELDVHLIEEQERGSQDEYIMKLAEKYDLKVFIADAGERVARLQKLSKPQSSEIPTG